MVFDSIRWLMPDPSPKSERPKLVLDYASPPRALSSRAPFHLQMLAGAAVVMLLACGWAFAAILNGPLGLPLALIVVIGVCAITGPNMRGLGFVIGLVLGVILVPFPLRQFRAVAGG